MEINQRGEVEVGVEGGVEVEKFCVPYYRHWSPGVPMNTR